MKHLVLGGARSGKSNYAQQQAEISAKKVIYIATAHAGDAEMQARIEQHKNNRPENWLLIEQTIELADALQNHDAEDVCLLVDCLTLWLSNLLLAEDENCFNREREKLFKILPYLKGDLVLVSNEVGQGIVPMGELNRRFIDESGWLHQDLAKHCDTVSWVMAGIASRLKGQAG
ncbi:MAG: bifunctional adenosylcobinamide kinase/adenosylcobinamide-phosphate guanylyltransferase [Gammaproteobacteria bacterium]|nr:bifunctional adenosylcobinamide kinase/adenosylcobinamide-phosphate guanylyltransferase [Gammaproteobacteria bacterium]